VVSGRDDGPSRRGLLGGAAAAAGAAVLAGCGSSSSAAKTSGQTGTSGSKLASPHDVELLSAALELERRTVNAYVACVPLLSKNNAKAAALWLSEELEHTGELISLIHQSGGKAQPRADSYEIGSMPRNQAQTFALLAGFEQQQVSYYLRIIPQLQHPTTRAGVATILGCDAQHIALLRLVLGRPAVPSALVS
jgi:Ferritin-like domain